MRFSKSIGRRVQTENDRVFHRLLASVFIVDFLYCFVHFQLGAKLSLMTLILGVGVLSPLSLLLNRLGFSKSARVLFLFSCNFYILFTSMGLNHSTNIEVFCFPAIIIAYVLFGLKQIPYVILGSVLSFVTWLLISLKWVFDFPQEWILTEPQGFLFNIINFTGAYLVLVSFLLIEIQSGRRKNAALVAARSVMENFFITSPDLMCVLTVTGDFKQVNQAFTSIFEVSDTELYQKRFTDFIHPDDLSKTRTHILKILKGGPTRGLESRFRCLNGEYRLIDWSAQLNAKRKEIFVTGRDITEHRSTQVRLEQVFAVLRDFAILAFTDLKGTITEVNDEFCRISGYTREELLGKDHRILNSGIHTQGFIKNLWRTIKGGNMWKGELQNRKKDGSLYSLKTAITPIQGLDGKPAGYLAIRFDVTDVRLKERMVDQLRLELEEAQAAARIAHWTMSPETQLFEASHGFLEMFCDSKGSRFIPFADYCQKIHPNERGSFKEKMSQCELHGTPFEMRLRVQAFGKWIWVSAIVYRRSGLMPGNQMVHGTFQDVTDLVSKEMELENRKRFLETTLDHLPLMILVKDIKNDFKFSLINQFGLNLLGWNPSDLIGRSVHDLFERERALHYHQNDLEIIQAKEVIKIEREDVKTSKGIVHLRTYKIPTYDDAGEPDLLISISEDISKELAIRESLEMERLKSIQNSKMAMLGEMSAGIAHEINNPLTIVSGTVQMLPRFLGKPEKLVEKIEIMKGATDRISKIVNGLRRFSRSSDRLDPPERRPHSLNEIIHESITMTDHKARHYSVAVEFQEYEEIMIICNEIEIEQILINLINNSIDAVKGLSDKWVRVTALNHADHVVLQVRDSGSGIPVELAEKLFQPFFTTKPVGEGTGLGLSIVKGILDDHQASITVKDSDPNTCFEIQFKKQE